MFYKLFLRFSSKANTERRIDMHKILLPIDTKSLYYNILNDNPKGHTCIVATPIKQGNSLNLELNEIYKIPLQIDFQHYPDLIDSLLKNSKSTNKINNVFVFSKIKINGETIKTNSSYCMFVKEEIDPSKAQFGRIKLHYPTSLKYSLLDIDNKAVISSISEHLYGFAFIVDAFEFDFDDNSLNFIVTIVGYNQIPYSKVFINSKGTGKKYTKAFKRTEDCYDSEIVILKKRYGDEITPENFQEYMNKANSRAILVAKDYLISKGAKEVNSLCDIYPYSIFDLKYVINGKTEYAIVKTSYTKAIYFDLSGEERQALALFKQSSLLFISEAFGCEEIKIYKQEQLNELDSLVTSVRLAA